KRIFDIIISLCSLIVLSPLFLFIAILIKIESKGPVFYVSMRAGTGYKIFRFYKFRTMRINAENELSQVLHLNQYNKNEGNTSFVKIEKDPRVTRLGRMLRNMSLDELPQLINVLMGDMSLVGNRPLPLYEAERLTKDQFAKRFLAPAGITGLWQISQRGKTKMSEDDRMNLDITYAEKSSFLYDIEIIFKTIPVLFQRQSV
ncbi:MAG: sugar transferase, partial [Cyclobacteriaceae bacterium]|nr:sugar transferase [Cyclobacteriaceae bacterium]